MEVLFHTFYRHFDRAEENRSLNRGLCYLEARYYTVRNIILK